MNRWEDVEEQKLGGDYRSKDKIISRKTKGLQFRERGKKLDEGRKRRKGTRIFKRQSSEPVEESNMDTS